MSKNKKPRVQTPKARNEPLMRAMQDLRRSSAAQPHTNKAKYTRKTKHAGKGWE